MVEVECDVVDVGFFGWLWGMLVCDVVFVEDICYGVK